MLYLHGLGHFHPENRLTNAFLEDLDIGTNDEWIMERVGIACRRTILDLDYIRTTKNQDLRAAAEAALYTNAQTGTRAARMALDRAGLSPQDIGLVISGSSSPEFIAPAEAATIAGELGIEVPCFDINNACSTFGTQINFLAAARPEALPAFILIVNPENITRSVDFADRNSAVLFGDGSIAAVVSKKVVSEKQITGFKSASRPSQWQRVSIPRGGFFQQDGNQVQRFAILKTSELLEELWDKNIAPTRRQVFIGHQANKIMLDHVCLRQGIAADRHWYNVDLFGNTGSAGAPSVLSQNWDNLAWQDRVVMIQVGAGLSWAGLSLEVKVNELP
jgi:3-oxoacyl-[acyl-carrier-protein] synthase-3